MNRQRVTGLLAGLATAGAGIFTGSASAASGCTATGKVLAHRDGLLVFTQHQADKLGETGAVYVCVPPSGEPRRLSRQSEAPRVSKLARAGRYTGFFLRTNVEVYSKFLVVFDRRHGRVELKHLAECEGNDECTGPNMTAFRLARNGWVAEVWPDVGVNGSATGLLATNGGPRYQLDLGRVRRLSLSAGRLSWSSPPFDDASVTLGPDVITPAAPRDLSACQLLPDSELAPVLGPNPAASPTSSKGCVLTGAGRTLTVTRTTGLSRAQVRARERALSGASGSYCPLGEWWPGNDNFHDLAGCENSGGHYRYASFSGGAELLLDLQHGDTHGEAELDHLSNVALDRLFAVPVART